MSVPIDLYVLSVLIAFGIGYYMNSEPTDDEPDSLA